MSFYVYSALINFATSLILVFIIFKKKKKELTDKIFILLCLSVAFWSFFYFLWQLSTGEDMALLWSRILMAGAIFIPVFYLHFVLVFLGLNKQNKIKIILVYVFGILSLLFDFTSLFVRNVIPKDFVAFWPQPGIYFHFFIIVWFIVILYTTILLIRHYKKALGIRRQQIKLVLSGIIIALIGGSTNYFLWYGINIKPIGNILTSVYVILIGYAIITHRLMDIKLVLRRSVVYSVSLILTVIPPIILKYLILLYLPVFSFWSDVILMIFAIAIFPLFRVRVYRFANKYLFSSLYDSKQVIAELSDRLSTTLEARKIYHFVSESLMGSFHTKAFAVLSPNKTGTFLQFSYNNGFVASGRKISLGQYDNIRGKDKIIIFDELRNNPSPNLKPFIREYNKDFGIDVLVPLKVKDKMVGVIALGPKESGDIYNEEDISVLKVISSQVAISLENASLYEETKGFNIKLTKEVEKATKELKTANEALKKLDEAKSEFISIASHQLRTPLTVIKGYVSMMLEGSFGKLEDKVDENLYKVYESNERLIHLVENLLNISRIESGRLQFNFDDVDLDDTVESVVEELAHNAKKKKLYLTYKKSKKTIPKIHLDEEKVRQVIINIIDNSIKYTKHGGVTITLEQKGQKIIFCVSDTGMGISKTDLPNLFQKFSRGKDTSLVHTEGTGLGLYVGKMMIEAHKGKVWAESKGVGKGSRFCFELPVKIKNPPKKLKGRVI